MSKEKAHRPFNFGRVFFPGEVDDNGRANPAIDAVRLQPLDNHVGNVRRLVELWRDLPCKDSLGRVLKAAEIHDVGKPQRFSIQAGFSPKGKFKNYIYSFRGHRFLAECEDAWTQAMARGHHDFSVGDIARDVYNLRKDPSYTTILNENPLAYAEELYVLEMCDQIEAELACRILDDDKQAESRTFMDYTTYEAGDGSYLLDPWPFNVPEVSMDFCYWSKSLSEAEKASLESCRDNGSVGKVMDRLVKDWWKSQQQDPPVEVIKATIRPAFQPVSSVEDVESTYQALARFSPNPMQSEVFDAIEKTDYPAIVVKAPTGAGKTESVLFPALAKGYRLFLPLPAKSLLEDQKTRVEKYLLRFSKLPANRDREVSLVVDTGSQMYRWVYQNGEDVTGRLGINLRRHLYKGDVILTTLDKFLYRYFSFGDQQKSFVFPLRINRSSSHRRSLICFDEAHSYDDIAFTNFQSLVRSLYEAGRSVVLMSATMPEKLLTYFDYLELIDYVDVDVKAQALQDFQRKVSRNSYIDQRSFTWIDSLSRDSEDPYEFQVGFAETVLIEWKAQSSRRILAVVETVKDAVAIYRYLKDRTDDSTVLFLYHGRLDSRRRLEVYQAIRSRDDDSDPYIVITTSAIEVGCDLNAETLITQICPPESLIQRAGRCNRRGNVPDARVIAVGDCIPDFANNLDEDGWKEYQSTLAGLVSFDVEKVRLCIRCVQHIDDYRVVEMFSMLHDYVYAADCTCQPAYDDGLIVTRSWTPSATLVYDSGEYADWTEHLSDLPQVSVPLDRLFIKKEEGVVVNQYSCVDVYERVYDKENTCWSMKPLRWGTAYSKSIFIRIGVPHEGVQLDTFEAYSYEPEIGFLDMPGLFTPIRSDVDVKLLYKPSENQSGSTAIIQYKKPLEPQNL